MVHLMINPFWDPGEGHSLQLISLVIAEPVTKNEWVG